MTDAVQPEKPLTLGQWVWAAFFAPPRALHTQQAVDAILTRALTIALADTHLPTCWRQAEHAIRDREHLIELHLLHVASTSGLTNASISVITTDSPARVAVRLKAGQIVSSEDRACPF
jgi:hypothetical protein